MNTAITGRFEKTHGTVSWSLVIAMLVLRIPFLGAISSFTNPAWLDPAYQIGTYLLTAVFIYWEWQALNDYHIDLLAIWIILLAKPAETLYLAYWKMDLPLTFPRYPSLMIWAIALGLSIALWFHPKASPKFQGKSLAWFGVGILAGIAYAIFIAFPLTYQVPSSISTAFFWRYLPQVSFSTVYQLGYAAVSEEPLFRGFLWGMLRKTGMKEVWVWLIQAGLFMLAHMYYFGKYPVSLFVVVPLGALVLGLIAWKSRTISASMALHATSNALGYFLARFVAGLLNKAIPMIQ